MHDLTLATITATQKHTLNCRICAPMSRKAPCILWSGVLERSYGVEYWSGEESNFGVAKFLLHLQIQFILTFSNVWTDLF